MSGPYAARMRPAELDETALARVHALEEALGFPVVAYAPESPYAPLTPDQLAQVRRAEAELGVQLLAFRS